MRRKNYTEFDTEFVTLDKRGKNCTRVPLLWGAFWGAFWAPP